MFPGDIPITPERKMKLRTYIKGRKRILFDGIL
jgi:hypothetical protein